MHSPVSTCHLMVDHLASLIDIYFSTTQLLFIFFFLLLFS